MRRIVEGLGLGLARTARKLVPVVLTLSGPLGFPRKLSGRRPKLPRQPRRGRVARARSRNFDAGSWPVGLLETIFRATAEASRQPWQTRAVARARSVILALGVARRASRNNFPGDGQSFYDSLPRARFRRFRAGGWPDGLPETSFRTMQSGGGILDADSRSWPIAQRRARCVFPFTSSIWTRPLAGRSRQLRSEKKSVAARYWTDSKKRRRAAISRAPWAIALANFRLPKTQNSKKSNPFKPARCLRANPKPVKRCKFGCWGGLPKQNAPRSTPWGEALPWHHRTPQTLNPKFVCLYYFFKKKWKLRLVSFFGAPKRWLSANKP